MNYYPIGSISIFINVNSEQNQILDDYLLDQIAKEFEMDFKRQVKKYDFGVDFYTEISWKRGCIIETLTLGIIIGGIYKFVVDYDKIRKNLRLLFSDLKNVYLKITKKNGGNTDDLPSAKIEIIRNVDELKDLTSNFEKRILTTEYKVTSIHRITIMRDDLEEHISDKTILEFLEKNKK